MKSIFTVLFLIAAMAEVRAQSIQGTMVLKGSIKTKIMVNGIKTVCKMKIDKVKNLLEEDAYGNPAYQLQAEIELDGTEFGKSIQVKHKQQTVLNNLHREGTSSLVKDLDYKSDSDNIQMTIDNEGRIVQINFPFQGQSLACKFQTN